MDFSQNNPGSDQTAADALVLTLPDDSSSPRDMALWAGVLALFTLVAYWPVTQGKFIWNDDRAVAQNRLLVEPEGLRKIWVDRWSAPKRYPQQQYRPFADTIYWIQFQLFGQNAEGVISPFGYHVTNIILAAAATIVLWLILNHLNVPGAWLAAAIFGLHPLNTEATAWISQMPTLLGGLLGLGSIYSFLRFTQEDRNSKSFAPNDPATKWGFYAASVLLFVLAMLSKSAPFAMPFVTGLILWWKRRWTTHYAALLMPMVFIGLVLAFSAVDFERSLAGANGINLSFTERVTLAGRAAWFYAGKLLLPIHLTFMYPKWIVSSDFVQFLPLVGILIVIVGCFVLEKRLGRGPLIAVVAFGFCLLPALGFFNQVRMQFTYVADHYAYLASAPFIALVVAGGAYGLRQIKSLQARNNTIIAMSALVLISAGAATWVRAGVFVRDIDLWQDTVQKNPDSWFAHDRYATDLGARADEQLAAENIDEFQKDLRLAMDQAHAAEALNPSDAEAQWIMGRIDLKRKNSEQGIKHLTRATELDPGMYEPWQDLASALIGQRQFQQAIVKLDEALRLQPQASPIHRLLGEAYAGLGDDTRAAAEFRLALQYKPDNNAAREDYGDLLARKGNIKEAKHQYTLILKTEKNRADLWEKVGLLCTAENNLKEAAVYFKAALAADPNLEEAKKNLDLATKMLQQQAATRPTTRIITH